LYSSLELNDTLQLTIKWEVFTEKKSKMDSRCPKPNINDENPHENKTNNS
jgi:hypothetical protein